MQKFGIRQKVIAINQDARNRPECGEKLTITAYHEQEEDYSCLNEDGEHFFVKEKDIDFTSEQGLFEYTARRRHDADVREILKSYSPADVNAILSDLLKEQEEIVSSPIRFNGVPIDKIIRVFEKYGVKYEPPF